MTVDTKAVRPKPKTTGRSMATQAFGASFLGVWFTRNLLFQGALWFGLC